MIIRRELYSLEIIHDYTSYTSYTIYLIFLQKEKMATNIDNKVVIGYFYDDTTDEKDVVDYFESKGYEIEKASFINNNNGKCIEITFKDNDVCEHLKDENETHFIKNEALMIQPNMDIELQEAQELMQSTSPEEPPPKGTYLVILSFTYLLIITYLYLLTYTYLH